jgi:hypothetical protein
MPKQLQMLVGIKSVSDPGANVAWAVAKLYALMLAVTKKADRWTVRKNQILEVQHERPASRLIGEHRGQLADIACLKSTYHGQHDAAIFDTVYLKH